VNEKNVSDVNAKNVNAGSEKSATDGIGRNGNVANERRESVGLRSNNVHGILNCVVCQLQVCTCHLKAIKKEIMEQNQTETDLQYVQILVHKL